MLSSIAVMVNRLGSPRSVALTEAAMRFSEQKCRRGRLLRRTVLPDVHLRRFLQMLVFEALSRCIIPFSTDLGVLL
ncbi:hypothetical protein CWO90_02740 [Bradyrhizobium sp. Leo121]|nr:hypothetical protein CWO90_02740 [Bradyrhizobium sp. Leo121]